MDISSKKLQTTISKFKKFSSLINILLAMISLFLLIFMSNKRDAVLIVTLIIFMKVSVAYIFDGVKIVLFLQHIREMSNLNYCVNEILEKTDEKSEISLMLGKKYKKIFSNLHKVEKYTYEVTLKGKQSENMTNSVMEDIGKKLIKPVENINKGIKDLKENIDNESIDYIENEAYKMKDTIEELFEFSKVITKNLDINIERLDLVSLTKQALIEYEGKLETKHISIKKNMGNEKVFINADGDKLWRIFEILLDNILDHSKEKTRTYIEINEKEENIELNLINISRNELNIDVKQFYEKINENKNLSIPIAINLMEIQGGKLGICIDGDMFKVTLLFKNGKYKGEGKV